MEHLAEIIAQFAFQGEHAGEEVCTDGHINDTYFLEFRDGEKKRRYVLQRINSHVFRDPAGVMANIEAVTSHIRQKVTEQGGDPEREVMTVISTRSGKPYYRCSQGEYWRAYNFIEGARTYQKVEDPVHFYHAGRSFGQFQLLLADFPPRTRSRKPFRASMTPAGASRICFRRLRLIPRGALPR